MTSTPIHNACRLSVVIPAYRGTEFTHAAVASLWPVPEDAELLVVDDGSSDGTAERLRSAFPDVEVIALERNRGFGGAVNAGFIKAHGEYLATLNNDARTTWADLDHVVALLEREAAAGAAAPALRDDVGRPQKVAFRFPAPAHAKLLRRLREGRTKRGAGARPIDYVKGACVVFRRAALEQVGLFDEQYWMFAEEIDLFRRLATGGWQTWVVPDATATHGGGRTTRNHPDRSEASRFRVHSYKSMCRYWSKHHGPLDRLVLRLELAARLGMRVVGAAVDSVTGRADPWWTGEHLRCLAVLFQRWPNEPREPQLPSLAQADPRAALVHSELK